MKQQQDLTLALNAQPIGLLICALGGEGGGVLSEWLIDIARHAGYAAQSTSIPGVAQRTGATTYYVEVFPAPLSQLAGKRPIFSLNPVPGALDALISSELLETARQVSNGMTHPARTKIISSTARAFTTQERMVMGDGRAESDKLAKLIAEQSREHHFLDMASLAKQGGTIVSAVMLGAIASSHIFPFAMEHFEAILKQSGPSAAASLKGFKLALDAMQQQQTQLAQVQSWLGDKEPSNAALDDEAIEKLGHERLVAYQGKAYAQLYTQRLQALDKVPGAQNARGEAARWLALWMAYDDIARVAQLKASAQRFERVRKEAKAGDEDLLKLYDHFKPGIPEFASLLPKKYADKLLAWDRARISQGKAAWSMPIKLPSHSIAGTLALRALAFTRRFRPASARYAEEQAMIEKWLQAINKGAKLEASENARGAQFGQSTLALELARCGRLIKGYGTTNERGKANLLHVIEHLLVLPKSAQALAQAVAEAREAALQDEGGKALNATLSKHGAAPKPAQEQVITFVRRPRHA